MLESLRNWPAGWRRQLVGDFLRSLRVNYDEELFESVEAFCIFLGHSRSGHSLIASLLDAHKNIVMADELRTIRCAAAGFGKNRIYSLILDNAIEISGAARERAGYKFEVPGQWQGRFETIKIIGDKDGSVTASMAQRNIAIVNSIAELFDENLRVLHIFRNPFDVISTIYRRLREREPSTALDHAIDYMLERQLGIEKVRECFGTRVLDVRYEEFLNAPEVALIEICHFLGVDCQKDYLNACRSLVFEDPRKTRFAIDWTPSQIESVTSRLGQFSYLSDYSFE